MSTDQYDTAVDIGAVETAPMSLDQFEDEKPKAYFKKHHFKWLLKRYALFASPTCAWLMVINVAHLSRTIAVFIMILTVAVGAFLARRSYHEYTLRPFRFDPEVGLLEEYQNGILIPWFMNDSSPEPYSADHFTFSTPNRSIVERMIPSFKNCATLELKVDGKVIHTFKDFRDVDHLLKCLRWYESAPRRQQARNNKLEEQQVLSAQDLARAMARVADRLEADGDQTRQILEVVQNIQDLLSTLVTTSATVPIQEEEPDNAD